MKKLFMVLASMHLCYASSFAQGLQLSEIDLVGGKTFTSFLYKDSEGSKDKTLDYTMNNSFGINFNLSAQKHVLRPELIFRQGGSKSDYAGTQLNWKLNYLDLNLGYLYRIIQTEKFEVAPGLAIGAGYLLNGDQYIGNVRYNVVDNKSLKRFDFGIQGITQFKMNITESFSLGLEYRFGMGITQIENDINAQKSRNIYHSALICLGIRFNKYYKRL